MRNILKKMNMMKLKKEFYIESFREDGFDIKIDNDITKVYFIDDHDPSFAMGTVTYDPVSKMHIPGEVHEPCIVVSNKFLSLPFSLQRYTLYHEYAHLIYHMVFCNKLENSLSMVLLFKIAMGMIDENQDGYYLDHEEYMNFVISWCNAMRTNK